MSPIEAALVAGIAALLFGHRIIPKWGRALGETVGVFDKKLDE